jgi:hypothetical protein
MKKILVLHYSQSGQLTDVVRAFTQPLVDDAAVELHFENIQPQKAFPFPWPFFTFLDTFPEAVYLDPPPLRPFGFDAAARYDLVILAYQVWFLSPSLPITGFLQSDAAKTVLRDTPVVTLIACRNMWLMAQEQVKAMLAQCGAKLVGNVALVDEAGSLGSFLATPVWVLSGKKGPHWGGLIPRAGVNPQQISACSRFGERIRAYLTQDRTLDESLLRGLGAVSIDERLIASERTARRGFRIWGGMLRALGGPGSWQRKPVLLVYVVFLVTFIATFIPLTMLLKRALAPLQAARIAQQKIYFGQPSGEDGSGA